MALPHQSIATINSPEFINLQPLDVNPLMSKCEIKVLYLGQNRNRSYISKEVATQMAKTLRGAPIVGYYKEKDQDFADHGEQMIWDDEGIHFNCLTKPYGFVAPDAKVWFQKFNDIDQFGNEIEREYLMTTGYLWTGQFEEVQSVITDGGKPQSMELQEESLQGHWATNNKTNIEFFIINDAIFTKLCILGDNTEPCFEGASVTAPEISKNFSTTVDNKFQMTLFSMMNELRDALKGGNVMTKEENTPVEEFELNEAIQQENIDPSNVESNSETETSFEQAQEEVEETPVESEFEAEETNEEEEISETFEQEQGQAIDADSAVEFEKKEEEEQSEEAEEEADEQEEEDDDKKKYSLLEQQYNLLLAQYDQLKAENDSLVEFKKRIEDKEKDALIDEFYMLSEADKKDVIDHKSEYSLAEIKAKLAVICYEKKVNFNSETSDKNETNKEENTELYSFTYNNDQTNLPDWVKAVKNIQETGN